MKPVMRFIKENFKNWKMVSYDDIFYELRLAGYFELTLDWNRYLGTRNDPYYRSCIDWLDENYPNDHIESPGTIFFTTKDIAALMKLSVW
jgi:hypothetical protein